MYEINYSVGKKLLSFDMPENWNELTQKQMSRLALLIHQGHPEELAIQRTVQILSGKDLYAYLRLPQDVRKSCEQYAQWVWEANTLTKNYFPRVGKFFGPADSLDNTTMVEFHFAELAYLALVSTKEEKYLEELIAVFFRPGKENYNHQIDPDSDRRAPFSMGLHQYMVKRVHQWSDDLKLSVLLWYDGCRQQLAKDYAALYPENKKSDNMNEGLFRLMRSIAGDKYGSFDQVEKMNVHTCHLEMICLQEEAEKLEEELNKYK